MPITGGSGEALETPFGGGAQAAAFGRGRERPCEGGRGTKEWPLFLLGWVAGAGYVAPKDGSTGLATL